MSELSWDIVKVMEIPRCGQGCVSALPVALLNKEFKFLFGGTL